MLDETTLVMGAGGPWGIAWMTGLLLGLEERDLAVGHARAMVGSSAGAILGARIGAGIAIKTLFDQETSRSRNRTAKRGGFAIWLRPGWTPRPRHPPRT
jgi:NTE family protein